MSTTLLRDIQSELSEREVNIDVVLRKCKILARRLHSQRFGQWVEWEMNGYPEGVEVPPYRTVTPHAYASFSNGYWSLAEHPISPFLIEEKWRHLFESFPFRGGISAVKAFATSEGAMIDHSELAFLIKGKVVDLPCHRLWLRISPVEFGQILATVTSRIIDFVGDVEAENPDAGEAPANEVPIAPDRVQQLVSNNFYGDVGNIAQHSSGFSQVAHLNLPAVRDLVALMSNHLGDLEADPVARRSAETQLNTLKTQLDDSTPNHMIIREAGRSLRSIVENIAAAVLMNSATPAVWVQIKTGLGNLF